MSQENVERFWEGIDALRRGDTEAIFDVVSEDVVWIPARSAVEGAYHGHAGLRRFLADNAENFEVFERRLLSHRLDLAELGRAPDRRGGPRIGRSPGA